MDADPPSTILVADDDRAVLRLLARVLERAGYQVVTAASVPEALERLRDDAPLRAVVADATLAPSGARDLFEPVRLAPGAPALIVTGGESPSPEERRELEACGGRFLAKPFAPAALLEALEAAASTAHSGPRAGSPRDPAG